MERFEELSRATNFAWLCSNVVDKETGKPLAGCKAQRVFEWHGTTVGVMGLVEYAWLASLTTLAEDQVEYTDFCEAGAAVARSLRANGADLVVALTHMAAASDERLAREVPDIDIVLGGRAREAEVRCPCPGTPPREQWNPHTASIPSPPSLVPARLRASGSGAPRLSSPGQASRPSRRCTHAYGATAPDKRRPQCGSSLSWSRRTSIVRVEPRSLGRK